MHARKRDPSIVYWLGNSLYLNVTNRCSNSCYFCFRKFKNGIREFNLKFDKEPILEEVIDALSKVINRNNWSEVVFCGFGESLERMNLVLEVARWLKKHYWKAIRVDTNGQGYLLNKGRNVVRELKEAGVDPFKDLRDLRFMGFPQDQIVDAVRDGRVDAGTVRTDILERMANQGVINLADFNVLNSR